MNKLIARTMTVVSLAVLLLAGQAYGQYVQRTIKVHTPFEFTASGKNFSAGEYSIVFFAPNRISLRDSRDRTIASFLTRPVEALENSSATTVDFSTTGGGHDLTRIWVENERIGYELGATKREALVAKGFFPGSTHASGAGNK